MLTAEQRVRAQCETQPNDDEWALLRDDGFVDEVLEQRKTAAYLDSRLAKMRKATNQKAVGLERRPAAPGAAEDWADALGHLLAAAARRDGGVLAFRAEVLGGVLFTSITEAATWVQAMAEGPHHDGDRVDTLAYEMPGSAYVHRVPAWSDTAIRLVRLSERLADQFEWEPARATTFVLCDTVPPPQVFNVTTRFASPGWNSRIIIEVHPMIDPADVVAAYKGARKEMAGWLGMGKRIRLREADTYRATAWVADHDADSWGDLAQEWNAEHPDKRYDRHRLQRVATRGLASLQGVPVSSAAWTLGTDDDLTEDA